jgi:hypothetical protein
MRYFQCVLVGAAIWVLTLPITIPIAATQL